MEDDTWAQTLFTITPAEDGYLREIAETTIISGSNDKQLDLNTDDIHHRESLINITRDFIDPRELEKAEYREVECQTYMGGVPRVQYVRSYRDNASQTLYIGKNYQPQIHQQPKDLLNVLNTKSLPKFKTSEMAQTIITVMEDLSIIEILAGLLQEITEDEQNDPELMVNATEDQLTKMEAHDILNYVMERADWIAGIAPDSPAETVDVETDPTIKYNYYLRRFVVDSDTQTNVSLYAKESNSKLLDDYQRLKDFNRSLLEEIMENGVYRRIIADDIIDEIIGRCCEFIHLPLMDEAIQTIAAGCVFDKKDEDVLNRLRNPVAANSMESSTLIPEIIDDVLSKVLVNISEDAEKVAAFVVDKVFKRTSVISDKLEKIRASYSAPPMDQVFAMRRIKLTAAMPKKRTMENASTQTGLAGVPELKKFQENKSVVCSVCPTDSACHWCAPGDKEPPKKDMKMLRTEDILLAYRPCYVVMDRAEVTEDMKRPCLQEPKEQAVQKEMSIDDDSSSGSLSLYEQFSDEASERRVPEISGSASGWSHVIATALTDAWISKTPSRESKSVTSTKQSEVICRSSKSQIPLSKTTIQALQILKSTFCNRETCLGLSNIIEDPKYVSSEISPKNSKKNRQLYVCANFTPPSDECICELNDQLRKKLENLAIEKQIESKR